MRWEKLGKLFDPRDHQLPNHCVEYAQSPQVLLIDGFVRIYFSTRQRDPKNGKFLSHIAYVDFDRGFERVIGVSEHTVLPLGELGCFDEHGIFPINPVRHQKQIFAYTCGWSRRVSVSVETGVGYVVSHDNGRTFERIGNGPIMGPSLREPHLVGDAFVKVIDGHFHMWYMFGTRWIQQGAQTAAERTYKIGHAVSDDGINWQREEGRQIIEDRLGDDECQALPTVIAINGRYHMFFCYRHSTGFRTERNRGYRIGHAYSDDLIEWTRDDDNPLLPSSKDGAWDADMQCYPHVFELEDEIYLLYNGNEFGRHGFGLARLER